MIGSSGEIGTRFEDHPTASDSVIFPDTGLGHRLRVERQWSPLSMLPGLPPVIGQEPQKAPRMNLVRPHAAWPPRVLYKTYYPHHMETPTSAQFILTCRWRSRTFASTRTGTVEAAPREQRRGCVHSTDVSPCLSPL